MRFFCLFFVGVLIADATRLPELRARPMHEANQDTRFAGVAANAYAEPKNLSDGEEEEEEERAEREREEREREAGLLKQQKVIETKCDYAEIRKEIIEGYEKDLRPNKGGPPEEISVEMQVFSIGSLNSLTQDVPNDFLLKMTWEDPRLKFKTLCQRMRSDVKEVWIPDWYLVNAGDLMSNIMGMDSVFINANGTMEYSVRIVGDLKCHMEFQNFPFDEQKCAVRVGALFLGEEKQIFVLDGGGDPKKTVTFNVHTDDLGGTEWDFLEYDAEVDKETNIVVYTLAYKRRSTSYVLDFVFPTAMMFVMVQCGFLMDMRFHPALPARAAIAIIPVLILTTQTSAAKGQVPKIDYATWLTHFLLISLLFMSFALVEFVMAYYSVQRQLEHTVKCQKVPCCIRCGVRLDCFSFYIFPIASAIFFGVMLYIGYSGV